MEKITIEFIDGLNDDPTHQLSKDSNGSYNLTLDTINNQTIQRITGRLFRYGEPIEDFWSVPQPKKVDWESNLYWWLMKGDVLVSKINESSYSDQETGEVNTVIGPIQEMI